MATPDMSNLTADIEAGLRSARRPGAARSNLLASNLNTAIRYGVRALETQGKIPPFAVPSAHQPRLDGADAAVPHRGRATDRIRRRGRHCAKLLMGGTPRYG